MIIDVNQTVTLELCQFQFNLKTFKTTIQDSTVLYILYIVPFYLVHLFIISSIILVPMRCSFIMVVSINTTLKNLGII